MTLLTNKKNLHPVIRPGCCGYAGEIVGSQSPVRVGDAFFRVFSTCAYRKIWYVQMNSRYGGIQMPEIRLADVGEYRRKKLMKGSFSPLLLEEMEKVLSEHKQVILFQNRRGYSSYVQCDVAGKSRNAVIAM